MIMISVTYASSRTNSCISSASAHRTAKPNHTELVSTALGGISPTSLKVSLPQPSAVNAAKKSTTDRMIKSEIAFPRSILEEIK